MTPRGAQPGATADVDVAVVGAGFAGLYMLYRLRGLGLRVRVFERGADVGGTWFWNRYPGARCDIESVDYSLLVLRRSSSRSGYGRSTTPPSRRSCATCNHVADRFDLRRDIQLGTRVTSTRYDEPGEPVAVSDRRRRAWSRPGTACSPSAACRRPKRPDFAGLDSFRGDWYHTAHVAARRGRLRRQAGRDHRHRVHGHPGACRRSPSRQTTSDRVPADAELLACPRGTGRCRETSCTRVHAQVPRAPPGRRAVGLRRARGPAGAVGARGHRGGTAADVRGRMERGGINALLVRLQRPLHRRAGQPHRAGVHPREDPADRERPRGRRDAVPADTPSAPSGPASTSATSRPSTATTCTWSTCAPRRSPASRRPACARPGRVRARRHRLRHRVRRDDRGAARDRHPRPQRPVPGRRSGPRGRAPTSACRWRDSPTCS